MTVKTILVPLDGSENAYRVLDTSLVVADRFNAHISALHVSYSFMAGSTYGFTDLPGKLKQTVFDQEKQTLEAKAAEVRARFEAFCGDNGVAIKEHWKQGEALGASWHHEFGEPDSVIVNYARIHDVCAFGRPGKDRDTLARGVVGDTLQSVMLESGRPILVVPPEWQARKCEHAVVAWNHSQEASRAVAMTLPWLRQMQSVTVVVAKQREEQGKQLLEYLDLHGVSASHTVLNRGGLSAGERLLDLNREIGGDFLVAGGFSTPRSSQRLFGGVTSHLLRHSDVITTLVH